MNRLISLLIYGTIIATKIRIKSVRNCAKQGRRVAFLSKQILLSERITWQKAFRTFAKLFFSLFKGRVAQRIRARGYEPRSRGFKSLLAQQKTNCTVWFSTAFHVFISFLVFHFSLQSVLRGTRKEQRLRKTKAPVNETD